MLSSFYRWNWSWVRFGSLSGIINLYVKDPGFELTTMRVQSSCCPNQFLLLLDPLSALGSPAWDLFKLFLFSSSKAIDSRCSSFSPIYKTESTTFLYQVSAGEFDFGLILQRAVTLNWFQLWHKIWPCLSTYEEKSKNFIPTLSGIMRELIPSWKCIRNTGSL